VFDRATFSRLLRKVSLGEAKEFSKMSYLCNIAYMIPKITVRSKASMRVTAILQFTDAVITANNWWIVYTPIRLLVMNCSWLSPCPCCKFKRNAGCGVTKNSYLVCFGFYYVLSMHFLYRDSEEFPLLFCKIMHYAIIDYSSWSPMCFWTL
jgi:hypothetical protein